MRTTDLDPRDPTQRTAVEALLESDESLEAPLEAALRRVATEADDEALRAKAKLALASNVRRQGRAQEAETLFREGLTTLHGSETHAEVRGLVNYALTCLQARRIPEALMLAQRAASIARRIGQRYALALARGHMVGALIQLGEFDRAGEVLDEMERDVPDIPATRRGSAARIAAAYRLEIAAETRDEAAAEAADATLAGLEPVADPRAEPWRRAMVAIAAGRHEDALAGIDDVRELQMEIDRHTYAFDVLEARCLFAIGSPRALEAARAALERLQAAPTELLAAGRRLRFAERLGLLLHGHHGRSADTALAFDIAGAAALERLAEVEGFLAEHPAFFSADDEEMRTLSGYRDRIVDEHRALLRAFGRMVNEDPERRQPGAEALCVCAWCRSVRGPDRVWLPLGTVPLPAPRASVTHGICTSCREEYKQDAPARTYDSV